MSHLVSSVSPFMAATARGTSIGGVLVCAAIVFSCNSPKTETANNVVSSSGPATLTPAPGVKQPTTTDQHVLGTAPQDALQAGTKAPTGKGVDAVSDTNSVDLSQWVGVQPTMIVFYRGGWCPYCNGQILGLVDTFADFQQRNVLPIVISVDKPQTAATTKTAFSIPFPVLSDSDLTLHKLYKVVFTATPKRIEELRKYNIDIAKSSGKDHASYAIPSVFLIDKHGTILWRHVDPDYKTRPTTNQLLEIIDVYLPSN